MGFLTILAAAGSIAWTLICFQRAVNAILDRVRKLREIEDDHPIRNSLRPMPGDLKDLLWSILCIGAGLLINGVTGSVIGLIASVFMSIYSRVRDAMKPHQEGDQAYAEKLQRVHEELVEKQLNSAEITQYESV